MPKRHYLQPDLFADLNAVETAVEPTSSTKQDSLPLECIPTADPWVDEWLDEASLKTVLDMLAVIDCVEELTLLETLTDVQKRQVWDVTPDAVKQRLKALRAAAGPSPQPIPAIDRSPIISSPTLDPDQELEVEDDEFLQPMEDFGTVAAPAGPLTPSNEPDLGVDDWIVLKAEPKLTAAELIAIWQVVAVQDGHARITAKGLGVRLYPVRWMIRYPQPVDS